MKSWWFTEDCYPHLPDQSTYRSIRVDLPNEHCDPEIAHDLYNRYLDLWCACDEIGLGIMLNEHHQTATCMVCSASVQGRRHCCIFCMVMVSVRIRWHPWQMHYRRTGTCC